MEERHRDMLAQGKKLFAQENWHGALKYLTDFVDEVEGFADVYNMIGVSFLQLSNPEAAKQALKRSLEINPGFREARMNMLLCCNELGEDPMPWMITPSPTESEEMVSEDLANKVANMYKDIGSLFLQTNRPALAVEEFRRALQWRDGFHDIRMLLAQALREQNLYEEAQTEYESILEAKPNYVQAFVQRGLCYYYAGELDKARLSWEKAKEIDPESRLVAVYLSKLESHSKEPIEETPT